MYIYTFKCAKCNHVWQKAVVSKGMGGMGGKCPNCECGNVRKISEEKVDD